MIFAAGLGTRLRPLTDRLPKALVPVGGRPLLEILLERLHRDGFTDVVINTHHLAHLLEDWCRGREGIRLSPERGALLDTGGGLRHAAPLLREGGTARFLIHNVDILSNADLPAFWAAGEGADATLFVSPRPTRRQLLFDESLRLVGWTDTQTGEVRSPHAGLDPRACRPLAFAGIHQMRTALLDRMAPWPERFGIIDFYLSLCRELDIRAHLQPGLRLLDVGKPEALAAAERFLAEG